MFSSLVDVILVRQFVVVAVDYELTSAALQQMVDKRTFRLHKNCAAAQILIKKLAAILHRVMNMTLLSELTMRFDQSDEKFVAFIEREIFVVNFVGSVKFCGNDVLVFFAELLDGSDNGRVRAFVV